MRFARTEALRFLLLALLLLSGEAFGLLAQFDHDLGRFVIAALLQGAVWAVAAVFIARRVGRPPLALILVTAALMRLGAFAAPVYLSDDIYRYIGMAASKLPASTHTGTYRPTRP